MVQPVNDSLHHHASSNVQYEFDSNMMTHADAMNHSPVATCFNTDCPSIQSMIVWFTNCKKKINPAKKFFNLGLFCCKCTKINSALLAHFDAKNDVDFFDTRSKKSTSYLDAKMPKIDILDAKCRNIE